MQLLRRLEQTLGRFAIPNLTVVLIACQVVAFVMTMVQPNGDLLIRFAFIPSAVLQGEVWRLITFLAMPPPVWGGAFALVWAFFFWYIFYLMGTALEHTWGVVRYNLFLLIWYVATVSTAFLTPDNATTNIFLETSVFLAFAYLFPDFELRLFFILPIKIKWLGLLTWILLGVSAAGALLAMQFSAAFTILASFANFFIFFGKDLVDRILLKRRRVTRQVGDRIRQSQQKPFHHQCTVCGKTDVSDPDEDFRYCSRCAGQHAYCSEHLHNHEHIQENDPDA